MCAWRRSALFVLHPGAVLFSLAGALSQMVSEQPHPRGVKQYFHSVSVCHDSLILVCDDTGPLCGLSSSDFTELRGTRLTFV